MEVDLGSGEYIMISVSERMDIHKKMVERYMRGVFFSHISLPIFLSGLNSWTIKKSLELKEEREFGSKVLYNIYVLKIFMEL